MSIPSELKYTKSHEWVRLEADGTVTLAVQRLNDATTAVSVDYATADGTASNGLKYTATNGTLTFAAGETDKTLVVPILNEGLVEGTESFQVILSNPTGGAVLGSLSTATVLITDNDTELQFEIGSYSVVEDAGFVLLAVLRGDDGDFPVSVDYATADGTAKSGLDYTGVTNTLFFASGDRVKTFTVPILSDGLVEMLGQQPDLRQEELAGAHVAGREADHLVADAGDQEPVAVVPGEVGEIEGQVAARLRPQRALRGILPAGDGGAQLLGHLHERRETGAGRRLHLDLASHFKPSTEPPLRRRRRPRSDAPRAGARATILAGRRRLNGGSLSPAFVADSRAGEEP